MVSQDATSADPVLVVLWHLRKSLDLGGRSASILALPVPRVAKNFNRTVSSATLSIKTISLVVIISRWRQWSQIKMNNFDWEEIVNTFNVLAFHPGLVSPLNGVGFSLVDQNSKRHATTSRYQCYFTYKKPNKIQVL